MTETPRMTAAAIVQLWMETEIFPEHLLAEVTEHRGAICEMVYGVVRRQRTLQWILEQYAARRPAAAVEATLLVGLYQLLYMNSVPDHAAVNETVQNIKTTHRHAAGFVNGVLRRILRERNQIEALLQQEEMGVRVSHPNILINRWIDRFGEENTEALCDWNNTVPDLVIHLNPLRTTMDELSQKMTDAGIEFVPHPFAPTRALVIPHGLTVPSLPGFAEGLFAVRDPSTSCAIELLDPQPGERILDACAAPGGKTVMLAQCMQDEGTIIAADLSNDRLDHVRQNAERFGLKSVVATSADATDINSLKTLSAEEPFDRILLDVPCTNTGVLRRRTDARWRFTPEFLKGAVRLQRAILDAAHHVLASGGTMIYSTCSLEPEEGSLLIRDWLEAHPDFALTSETSLFPPESGTDGAYAARLEKQ